MIVDHIRNMEQYAALGPNFRIAADYLRDAALEKLAPGKIEIAGDRVFGTLTEKVLTAPPDFWEVHRAYADIQIVLRGTEAIGYVPLSRLGYEPEFPEDRDAVLFRDLRGMDVILQAGEMAILLPQDIHRPNTPVGRECFSRKLLLKVALR